MEVQTIYATDSNGITNIFYICQNRLSGSELINISVFDNDEFTGEFFEFIVVKKNTITKVQNMFAHDNKYRKKGLPEELIAYAKTILKSNIYSSSVVHQGNDYISEEGKKVWKRLIENHKAVFDKSLNRYKTI